MADTYTTMLGDMWDLIAWRVYGSSMFVNVLMEANPEHLHTFQFSAGVVLNVPVIEAVESAQANVPPWRRRQ